MKIIIASSLILALSSCSSLKKDSPQPAAQPEQRSMSSVGSDSFGTISCPYTIYSSSYGEGIKVENKEGKWQINYTRCTDGEKQYTVSMGQDKFFNLDFLADKTSGDRFGRATGQLNLTCVGTDINGIYKAGAFAGVGLMGSARVGVFASVVGAQSICVATDFKLVALGVEVSPYSLEIRTK